MNLDTRNISNTALTGLPAPQKLFITHNGTKKEVGCLYYNGKEIFRKRITVTLHSNQSYYASYATQTPDVVTKSFTMRWGSTMNSTELSTAQAQSNSLATDFNTNVTAKKHIVQVSGNPALSYTPIISRTNANGPFYTASNLTGAVNLNTYFYSSTADSVTLYAKWINNSTITTSTTGQYWIPLFARSLAWWGIGHGGGCNAVGGTDVSGDYRKECVLQPPGHDAPRVTYGTHTSPQNMHWYAAYDGATAYLNYYNTSSGWQRLATSGQPGNTGGGRYVFNVRSDTSDKKVLGDYGVAKRLGNGGTSTVYYYMYQDSMAASYEGVRYMRFYGNGSLVYNWPLYNVYYTTSGGDNSETTTKHESPYGAYYGGWPYLTGGSWPSYGRGAAGGCAISTANGKYTIGAGGGSAGVMVLTIT